VPRAPDQAAVKVDPLDERVGLAHRRNESNLSELRLDCAADDASGVGNDAECPMEIRRSVEPQRIHAHGHTPWLGAMQGSRPTRETA
jgi:hypothetical protein